MSSQLRELAASWAGRPQEQELQADARALEQCIAAGYEPHACLEVFDILGRFGLDHGWVEHVLGDESGYSDATRLLLVWTGGSSHPPIAMRREALLTQITQEAPLVRARDLAETGMTYACARCRLRCAPRAACPRCEGALLNLKNASQRRSALLTLQRSTPPAGQYSRARLVFTTGMIGFAAIIIASGIALFLMDPTTHQGAIVMAVFLASSFFVMAFASTRDFWFEPRTDYTLEPYVEPPTVTERERSVQGQVRTRRPVSAPESGAPCAAWRIEGQGPSGMIDDAGIGEFDIIDQGRVVARVCAQTALIDLPEGRALPPDTAKDSTLSEFLRTRGAYRPNGRVALAEALLRDGDAVTVSGAAEPEVGGRDTNGYRGGVGPLVFSERPLIRKTI